MAESVKTLQAERSVTMAGSVSQLKEYIAPVLLAIADYGMIVLALLTSWYVRAAFDFQPFTISHTTTYFIIPLIYLLFMAYSGLYSKRLPFWQCAEMIFRICIYVNVLAIVSLYVLGSIGTVSRFFVVLSGILCFIYLCIARWGLKRVLVSASLWQKPVIIIGAGKTAELLADSFDADPGLGYKIAGMIEDCSTKERPLLRQYTHLGCFDDAEAIIKQNGVKDVILAVPGFERNDMLDMVYRIQPHVRNLTIVPDLFGMPLSNMEVETLFNEQTVMLKVRNNLASMKNRIMKRTFDFLLAIPILIAILPVLIILSAIIKLDSNGPILHIAKRLGKNGQEFYCYKYRTMHVNGDEILQKHLANDATAKIEWETFAKLRTFDPRVTKAGVWMRKFSLDELPQIINVLRGEMSLVGPRPYLPREKKAMGYCVNTILQTVPGITGLWQVSGRNEIDFNGRLRLDEWYVRNWSLWHDIVLLLKTVNVVFGRKGAY